MPVIKRELYEQILVKYNQLDAEIMNGQHNDAAIQVMIENKYNKLNKPGIIVRENKDVLPELISLYLLAKGQQTFIPNERLNSMMKTMYSDLVGEMGIRLGQLNSLEEAIANEVQVDPKDFEELKESGKMVLNTQEYKDKEAAEAKRKKEEAKQKADKEAKEAKDREEKKKKQERDEKLEGDKIWKEREKNVDVPKYDPNKASEKKKEAPKHVYSRDDVSSQAIGEYLSIATGIYGGYNPASAEIDGKEEFSKSLSDNEISEKLRSNPHPPLTVDNVIDRVAMYRAQKAKFDSLNPFKRFFSVFFSDARKLKNNMNAIENSFSNEGVKAFGFKNIVNNPNPPLHIVNAMIHGIIGYKNDEAKKLFEDSSINKKAAYMKQHPELIEKNENVIDSIKQERADVEKKVDEQIKEDLKKVVVVIPDEHLEEENDLNKSFYDIDSHIKGLKDAAKYNEIKELQDEEEQIEM